VTPLANQSGSAVITITVTDSGGLSASDNFALSVTNTNVVVAGTIVWTGPARATTTGPPAVIGLPLVHPVRSAT